VAGAPATGAATVPADCSRLVFAPSANFFGDVPIRISFDDATVELEYTVAVTVTNVNDAPVAADDTAETDWNTPIDIPVLGNDVDVDGDPLTIAVTTQPAAGSATVSGSSIRYTPTFGAGGNHSFNYRICDPSNACDTATVTVSVAAITVVNDDTAEARSGRILMIPVASNDTPGSGRWHRPSFRITVPPDNGRARALGWGRIGYTSTRGFTGVDSVVYEICDTDNSCDSGTVTITVVASRR
jgi:hypothetical protein